MLAKRQSTTHRNFLKLSKAEKYTHGTEYIDLNNWLEQHKNSFKRSINDKQFNKEKNQTAPIVYEDRSWCDIMLNSISNPRSAEGRQWWNEVLNW